MADTDVNDEALFAQQSQEIDAGVARARETISQHNPTGFCRFCFDQLPDPSTSFCDEYCREFHRRETHNMTVRGR